MFWDFFQSYLNIKTSMWECWHICVQCAWGCLYCKLPLIITFRLQRDPLERGAFSLSGAHLVSPSFDEKTHTPLWAEQVLWSHSGTRLWSYRMCCLESQKWGTADTVSVCHCLLCAPRSMHECAPVKIDLLKGQQPLNLLQQEACSALQGDSTLRNMGWEGMQYISFTLRRQVVFLFPTWCWNGWRNILSFSFSLSSFHYSWEHFSGT